MQKLLAFIIAKRHWFLLIICEIISFALIYQNNAYQRNVMLYAANAITGRIMYASNAVFSYFDLQQVNQELHSQNCLLEMKVLQLQEQMNNLTMDKSTIDQVFLTDTVLTDGLKKRSYQYEFIPAYVVSNSVVYRHNYITINKGFNDGIHPDMGVVSSKGIVGIVTNVSDRFALVMSLLNLKSKVSCKIQHTHFFGPLSWKGGDLKYGFLEQIPTHALFQVGDTIVTSGYSDFFPPGVMVGILESYQRQADDNFYSLKVRISTDFQSLNSLYVINNQFQNEQKKIEREGGNND